MSSYICILYFLSGFERHFKGLAPVTPVGMRAFPRIMPFTAFRRACAFHKGMKGAARSGVALSQGPQFAMGLHPNNNGTRRGQSVLECAPHCSAMAPPLSLRAHARFHLQSARSPTIKSIVTRPQAVAQLLLACDGKNERSSRFLFLVLRTPRSRGRCLM